ncbi:MAG: mannitol dehydrogenase family protein [Hyphomonadaceae bacterium]|nr:mannitol dehydrogenase family protein [Hyphomonadaceae bacterium]
MMRLSDATLHRAPPAVRRPAYDRAAMACGVVHLGVGAFHRAHQAAVFDDALAAGDRRWGVLGASLRNAHVRDQLAPQDGLYTLRVLDGDRADDRIIGALRDVIVAPHDPAGLIAAMRSPDVHLVTLTITEKGYCLDPASGALRVDDPDIRHDAAHRHAPRTALGFLVAALAARRADGAAPFTVMSCDNLPHNGDRTRSAVVGMARLQDRDLAAWIADAVRFPNAMVDRIAPATTPDDIAALRATLGLDDLATIKTEPFLHWVIEDRFSGPRPDFATPGVQITRDVAPWEAAKLRLLNGAHSALAYLGALAGHETVAEAIAAPGFGALVDALWDEAETTLSPPADLDIAAYRAALKRRFANSALRHRLRQIAMDGSQKLPQRLLETARARLRSDRPIAALALAIAGWMRWQIGRDERGAAFVVDDPLAARTAALIAGAGAPAAMAQALMTLQDVFGADLPQSQAFRAAVTAALEALLRDGAARTVQRFAAQERTS